jgi:hypothetical protein
MKHTRWVAVHNCYRPEGDNGEHGRRIMLGTLLTSLGGFLGSTLNGVFGLVSGLL